MTLKTVYYEFGGGCGVLLAIRRGKKQKSARSRFRRVFSKAPALPFLFCLHTLCRLNHLGFLLRRHGTADLAIPKDLFTRDLTITQWMRQRVFINTPASPFHFCLLILCATTLPTNFNHPALSSLTAITHVSERLFIL